MVSSKLEELAKYKAKIADLEKAVVAERRAQLVKLHAELGYDSREDLIAALRSLGKGKPGRNGKGRRKRTVITPELREKIVAAAKEGKLTGSAIAGKFDVSLPTVQNIKRAAGLTRK